MTKIIGLRHQQITSQEMKNQLSIQSISYQSVHYTIMMKPCGEDIPPRPLNGLMTVLWSVDRGGSKSSQ